MPITTKQAFQKRQVKRDDGVNVLPRAMVKVAAIEAGYNLPSPTINDAVANSKYPGQMTAEEFMDFCEQHQSDFVSAADMAKAVVVVAPSNVITRASLEKIISKSSQKEDALSEEEIDALFATLDKENKSAITAEDFMRALYGEEGVLCLTEQRIADAKRAQQIKDEEARRAEEEARKREAERRAAEERERARKEAEEKKKKADACC